MGQEFLYLVRIPPDSSGFLFPPKAVWRRPATKEGSLLSTIWTKIDLINLPTTVLLDYGVRCPRPLLAPPGLKAGAAAAA